MPAQMTAASTAITALLRDRHDLAPTDTADFNVFNQTQLLAAASSISAHADPAARRHRLDLARSSAASGS